MLRRQPTAITLTSEDVAAYDDNRLARLAQESALRSESQVNTNSAQDSDDDGKRHHFIFQLGYERYSTTFDVVRLARCTLPMHLFRLGVSNSVFPTMPVIC